MQPPRGLDPRILLVTAILGLVGGSWLAGTTASPDDRLVSLLGRLKALLSTSIVVASAIVSATAIAAAVLIPLVTVWAIRRSEEPPPTTNVPVKAIASPPEARKSLPPDEEPRALPTPRPSPASKVERRSTITPVPPDQPQGTA
jgi:hypothetical protein